MSSTLLAILGLLHPLLHLTSGQDLSCITPDAKPGVCISIKQCSPLVSLLQSHGISAGPFLRASLCSFQNRDPIVCCPSGNSNDVDSERGSKEVQSNLYGPLYPPQCGFSNASHTRVVGGVPAQQGAWPWIAILGYRNSSNPSKPRWLCGGSLLSSRHILTAAHCVHNRNDLYLVRLGEFELNNDADGAHPMDFSIEHSVVHPYYSATNYINDVAVLKLNRDVPFTEFIHPICLPVGDLQNKDLVRSFPFVAGWGSIEFRGQSSDKLLEIQVPVVSQESCKSAYEEFKNVIIDDRVLCAGFAQGGKDACQGDSGGPLMFPIGKYYYVYGVVSFGYQCAQAGYPGIYTKVPSFHDFIIAQLR